LPGKSSLVTLFPSASTSANGCSTAKRVSSARAPAKIAEISRKRAAVERVKGIEPSS
jgi:hypothetical protein